VRRFFFTAADHAANPNIRLLAGASGVRPLASICVVALLATCGGCHWEAGRGPAIEGLTTSAVRAGTGSDGEPSGDAASDARSSARSVERDEQRGDDNVVEPRDVSQARRKATSDAVAIEGVERMLASGPVSHGGTLSPGQGGHPDGVAFGWFRDISAPDDPTATEFRWRHAGLDQWLTAREPRLDELRLATRSKQPEVRATAQIGLARYGTEQQRTAAAEAMEALVDDRQLALPTRLAAAETLGYLPPRKETDALDRLAARYAAWPENRETPDDRLKEDDPLAFSDRRTAPYVAALHVEVLRALARQRAPSLASHIEGALRSPSPEVRAEALVLVAADASIEPMADITKLVRDSDSRVRAAAVRVVAVRHRNDALSLIEEATGDVAPHVRLAAVESLGILGSPPATSALRRLAEHRDETIRGAAISALAALGDYPRVYAAAFDTSWRVRRVVACALSGHDSDEAESVAGKLLTDGSIEVQACAVESVANWSQARAVPLLLAAAGSPIHRTRLAAIEALRKKWPGATELRGDDPPQVLAERIAGLERAWQEDSARMSGTTGSKATVRDRDASAGGPSGAVVSEAAHWLDAYSPGAVPGDRSVAADRLIALGGDVVPALEALVRTRGVTIDDEVYCHVLPRVDEEFAALEDLRIGDLTRRRAAASWLSRRSLAAPLRPLVVQRMADIAQRQSDAAVWHDLLAAVSNFEGEAADRLAYTALLHEAASVRLAACRYLEDHAAPRHVSALEPLLSAIEVDVVKAAAAALGQSNSREAAPPLMLCLTSSDKTVRIAAAKALSQLGVSSGPAALDRLSLDREASVRRMAAQTMGELTDPLFATALVRLLDDEPSVRHAALVALPRITGQDIGAAGGTARDDDHSQTLRWKEWYSRGGVVTARDDRPSF